jgi:hypothetical protein
MVKCVEYTCKLSKRELNSTTMGCVLYAMHRYLMVRLPLTQLLPVTSCIVDIAAIYIVVVKI